MIRVWRAGLLMAGLALTLSGCDTAPPKVTELGGQTMGSHYSVKLGSLPPGADIPVLSADIKRLLDDIEQVASTWRPDSELSRLNANPANPQAISATLSALIALGLRTCAETQGALDITVGKLVDAWGFGPTPAPPEPLPQTQIDALRGETGCDTLRLSGNTLTRTTAAHINVNAITQGYAAERIAELLEAKGMTSYLVDMSGELVARGKKPDGSAWKIGIEVPERGSLPGSAGGALQNVVELHDMAIATSGDYRNFREQDGVVLSHVLDPRSGRPAQHALASVTVLDPSVATADGLSTALLVKGPEQGLSFARERQLAALFIIRSAEGFREEATPAFMAYSSPRGDVP
jgi:thiamine biosynthesis lipoprotein